MTNDIMPVVEEVVEELALKESFLPSAQNIVDQGEGPCLVLWSSMLSLSIKDSIADYRTFEF